MKKIKFNGMSLGRALMWLAIVGSCITVMFFLAKGIGSLFNSIKW